MSYDVIRYVTCSLKILFVSAFRQLHKECRCIVGMACDRWLQEDKIPLLNAHRCLLPDMKYSSFDFLTFSVKVCNAYHFKLWFTCFFTFAMSDMLHCSLWQRVPPVSRLTHFAASVAVRLGIKALPPVDVCLVAQRFIVELRLPSKLAMK